MHQVYQQIYESESPADIVEHVATTPEPWEDIQVNQRLPDCFTELLQRKRETKGILAGGILRNTLILDIVINIAQIILTGSSYSFWY